MEPAPYLSAEEAAELLGVSAETVKRHLRAGRLPGRKVGRLWRVSRAALDAFLVNHQGGAELELVEPEATAPSVPSARALLHQVHALRAAVAADAGPHLVPEALRDLRSAVRELEHLAAHLQSRAPGARRP